MARLEGVGSFDDDLADVELLRQGFLFTAEPSGARAVWPALARSTQDVFLVGNPGYPCFAAGTPIALAYGSMSVPVERVRVGANVRLSDGRPCRRPAWPTSTRRRAVGAMLGVPEGARVHAVIV